MTAELERRVLDMLEAGLSTADIAWHERCAGGLVEEIARRLDAPVAPAAPAPAGDWSEHEDAIVDEMRLRLLEAREIRAVLQAEGFRRPTRSVGLRMRKLADRAARGPAR